MLVERGPEGFPAGTIAERLGIPPSSLTFHLQQLLHAGLVTQRRLSRQLIYAADFAAMNQLLAYLTQNCCGVSDAAACGPNCNPVAPAIARARSRTHRRSA
jgi:DNA-binding transcriptional ArsR family regulator